MEIAFLDFFEKFKHLKMGDLKSIYSISKLRSFRAGDLIASEGDEFHYCLAILKGMIRTYVLHDSGKERTTRIVREKSFAGCASCLFGKGPSTEYLEALEDTWVVAIDVKQLKQLADTNIRLMKLWSEAVSEELILAVDRIQFFVMLTPEERYAQLIKESPVLLNRVPQKYLASYLGVTTVSLSRIRSRYLAKP